MERIRNKLPVNLNNGEEAVQKKEGQAAHSPSGKEKGGYA